MKCTCSEYTWCQDCPKEKMDVIIKIPHIQSEHNCICLNCEKPCNRGFCSEICSDMWVESYIRGKQEWNTKIFNLISKDKDLMDKINQLN